MSRPTLSVAVVAHNEEDNLSGCLERLQFADEIVVVLDRCTDRSVEIAARYAGRVIEGAWPLEGDRRNAAIDECTGEWILEVDADERPSPGLADEIRAVIAESGYDWHNIPFDNYIGGRLVRYGWGASFGVSSAPRLFRKGAKTWGRERVHPSLKFSGRKGPPLNSRMEHYVDRNISEMIQRLDRYTSLRASDLRDSGDIGSMGHNVRRIASRFWKCYVARRGWREGPYGFLIALLAGLYPILSYLKARLEDE